MQTLTFFYNLHPKKIWVYTRNQKNSGGQSEKNEVLKKWIFFPIGNLEKSQVPPSKSIFNVQIKRLTFMNVRNKSSQEFYKLGVSDLTAKW